MIDLYTWATPNGRKVSILLEELGVPYNVRAVDINNKEQLDPAYVNINPNNKIPTIVDLEAGTSVMESAAIMIYLTDKFGRLAGDSGPARYRVIEWLMWQSSSAGPMMAQAHHYLHFNPNKAPYTEERLAKEMKRLYGVLERQLDGNEFVAGEYSIADIGLFPWIARFGWQRIDLTAFPNIRRWYVALAAHPAVQKGYHVPKFTQDIPIP